MSIFIGRLPRRREPNKREYWMAIKDFSELNRAKRINVCKSSVNVLVYNNQKYKAKMLSPANSGTINYPTWDFVDGEWQRKIFNVKSLTALWKYSKVREGWWSPLEVRPCDLWFKRRREGFKYAKTKKRIPRNVGYSEKYNTWVQKRPMDFIAARKLLWAKG